MIQAINSYSPYSATTPIFSPIKRNAASTATGTSGTTGTGTTGTGTSGTGTSGTSLSGTSSSGTSTAGSTSASGIGSTFLSLLVEELQNQDPTNPMDSTAMTGQMISLNQLDQLVSINQDLGGNPGTLNGASTGSNAVAARSQATLNPPPPLASTASPFSPNAMLPQ